MESLNLRVESGLSHQWGSWEGSLLRCDIGGSGFPDSRWTGFSVAGAGRGLDQWKWVEDAQKYTRSFGSQGRAGEVDLEVSSLSHSRLLSLRETSQVEVLLLQGKRNCFLGVRNKKRLEVDFNLGTWQNPSCCPQTTRRMSFPLPCSEGVFLNFIAHGRLML